VRSATRSCLFAHASAASYIPAEAVAFGGASSEYERFGIASGPKISWLEMWRPQASVHRHGAGAGATDTLSNVRSCRDGILGVVFQCWFATALRRSAASWAPSSPNSTPESQPQPWCPRTFAILAPYGKQVETRAWETRLFLESLLSPSMAKGVFLGRNHAHYSIHRQPRHEHDVAKAYRRGVIADPEVEHVWRHSSHLV
jgi:hypothetical protein